jgi:Stealth protein CR2, conserved region 2/Stealth protein CR3, conserved region 3/Stealth protein CR4, conserved region 4
LQRAANRHDLNPNRYRDNLDLLRYNLRSLERYVPWARRVFLVTCRPQVPPWLDRRAVRLVHHDEFMPAELLPTFNSFAIVSQLHRLPGLSERFVYVEDDRLFGAAVAPTDLFDDRGRPLVYLKWRHTRAPRRRNDARLSPWNRALACSNHLLNTKYGTRRRPTVSHAPLPIEIASWRAMIAAWPDAFAHTAASPFRDTGNVAPEHLYPHFLLEEGRGAPVPLTTTFARTAYHPLNNVALLQRASFARLRLQRPMFVCMNDNYGARPAPKAVAVARAHLERWLPTPSRFELRGALDQAPASADAERVR